MRLQKIDRLNLFFERLSQQSSVNSPNDAWDLISRVLGEIEKEYAAPGDIMTISRLDDQTVQQSKERGYEIPLIGYYIFINKNGAICIHELWGTGKKYRFNMNSAQGSPYREELFE